MQYESLSCGTYQIRKCFPWRQALGFAIFSQSKVAFKPEKPARTILDVQVSFKRWDTVALVLTALIKWASLFGIAWLFRASIGSLAGKATFADIALRVIGNVKVSRGLVALLAASGWIYGLGQGALRRRHIKRVATQKNELERILDPQRTSSDLTSKGTTPSEKGRS
jgi:hypothetical protein